MHAIRIYKSNLEGESTDGGFITEFNLAVGVFEEACKWKQRAKKKEGGEYFWLPHYNYALYRQTVGRSVGQ